MSPVIAATATARGVAVAAAVGFLVIAIFQAALALGAPLGRAAWGGTRTHLPTGLRIASAAAVVFWLLAALIVLGRAGFGDLSRYRMRSRDGEPGSLSACSWSAP